MTITRLFFYATFATCPLWATVAVAHPSPQDAPAAAASVSAPAAPFASKKPASHVATKSSQVDAKPAGGTGKMASSPEASANAPYHLSHTPHRLDSYQNAVTPPPSTNER